MTPGQLIERDMPVMTRAAGDSVLIAFKGTLAPKIDALIEKERAACAFAAQQAIIKWWSNRDGEQGIPGVSQETRLELGVVLAAIQSPDKLTIEKAVATEREQLALEFELLNGSLSGKDAAAVCRGQARIAGFSKLGQPPRPIRPPPPPPPPKPSRAIDLQGGPGCRITIEVQQT